MIPLLFPLLMHAPDTPLPELLAMGDGSEITSVAQWSARREELRALFEEHVYGHAPDAPRLEARTLRRGMALDGKASFDEIELSFAVLGEDAHSIHLLLVLPASSTGPVPVFLGLNKCGNHTALAEAVVRQLPWREKTCAREDFDDPGDRASTWCVDLLIARGYGLATFCCEDLDTDRHEPGDGIQTHYPEHDWATIRAWAWGFSRAIDHLVTDARVDAERIAVIGHSRRGKTALLAAAFDERIGMVVPHQSGTGGCALWRDNDQETLERITRVFPHWFIPRCRSYAGKEADLPVDQHQLVAMIAPRPVLETVGAQDTWANFDSSLRCLTAASAAWELSGQVGCAGRIGPEDPMPTPAQGRVAQLLLDKPHVLDADYWRRILDFADVQLGR